VEIAEESLFARAAGEERGRQFAQIESLIVRKEEALRAATGAVPEVLDPAVSEGPGRALSNS